MSEGRSARRKKRRTRKLLGLCAAILGLALLPLAGFALRDHASRATVPTNSPTSTPVSTLSPKPEPTASPIVSPTPSPAPTFSPTAVPTPEPLRVQAALPYLLVVNKKAQLVLAYTTDEHGKYTVLARTMRCSTGKMDKLPNGNYKLRGKGERWRWRKMFSGVYVQYATRISGNILFHSISYKKPRSNTLLSKTYRQLGKPVSAGCVRLLTKDAKWIYDNCPGGTRVRSMTGEKMPDAQWFKPELIGGRWDPTDPDPDNPDFYDESSATPAPTPYPYATPVPTPKVRYLELHSGRR